MPFEPEIKEEIVKLKSDFLKLKSKKKFAVQDEDKLITDVSGLLGLYAIEHEEELRHLISEIISFAESKRWSMAGSRYLFEKLNRKYGF